MGDCRLQVRYAGSLVAELGGDGVPSSGPSSYESYSKGSDDDARESACSSCRWFVSSPSADSTLRQITDGILIDLEGRRRRSRSNGTCSADKTATLSFGNGIPGCSLLLYDMTLHPPRNITPMVLSHNSALTGPKAKTLQELGWFPSARLAVCYERDIRSDKNDTNADVQSIVDIVGEGTGDEEMGEYNRTKRLAVDDSARMVQLTGLENNESVGDGYRPKVSEMMAAVADRDVGNDAASVNKAEESSIAELRIKKTVDKRKKEARRTARLDEAIRRIDDSNAKKSKRSKTNANVSAQVKKMLIKSRAVGTKSLREDDRLYLETLFVDDTDRASTGADEEGNSTDNESSSYRFFSRVAKVGHVASTSATSPVGSDATLEVLVRATDAADNTEEYRRLPNLMALHEAEEQGYLHQFDRIVVRKYTLCSTYDDGSGPTKSILDVDVDVDVGLEEVSCDRQQERTVGSKTSTDADQRAIEQDGTGASCTEHDDVDSSSAADLSNRIFQAIEVAEASSSKGGTAKKKKKSTTSKKVMQILIKGKAKGDKKAVKECDRFYLEGVLVGEDCLTGNITANAPPAPYFFNRMASIESSILRALGVACDDGSKVELYVRGSTDGKDDAYRRLEDHTIRFCDAEKTSLIQQFSCVVVKTIK
mmetsp:Transcript_5731/g.16133  ORF Transcript_5731/g.16133 Transcript_5731/m.16133 type:complete len:651 (+) Transcript_5731:70-2022(+)